MTKFLDVLKQIGRGFSRLAPWFFTSLVLFAATLRWPLIGALTSVAAFVLFVAYTVGEDW